MSPRKTIRVLGAMAEQTMDETRRMSWTGNVALNVVPEWMSSQPVVTASLTPKAARRLATALLVAADSAEDNQ